MSKDMSMIAYCGLNCAECQAYLATQNDDDVAREKVAKQWSEAYKVPIKTSHINCDGCKTESGRLFGYCQMCEVKSCGEEKKVDTCAHCDDYGCDKIQGLFKMAPTIKEALEKIGTSL